MSRWHENCGDCDIHVDDAHPGLTHPPLRCRTCGASSELTLKHLLASPSPKYLGIVDDDDSQTLAEPIAPGRKKSLNLWWPTCLPFINTQPGDDENDDPGPEEKETNEATKAVPSVVYPSSLGPGQIRLACLSPLRGTKSPVHLDLEVYDRANCPEYETVSYTWGGEDGNANATEPIYVGPDYDIMLQTKNCVAALQWLHPQRGIRLVWIDALCVDQFDNRERDSQVAMMGSTYSKSARTVLWLGNDVVHAPVFGRHPTWHSLSELGKWLPILTKRRYFSRVWVIQELLLTPKVIIPFEDKIYWADASIWSQTVTTDAGPLSWPALWYTTVAPWVQYICQGKITNLEFEQTMALVWHSDATDTRDKLFAVAGLLAPEIIRQDRLVPRYDLDEHQVMIGLLAFCLLTRGNVQVLFRARGVTTSEPFLCPSWLPYWTSQDLFYHLTNLSSTMPSFRKTSDPELEMSHVSTHLYSYASDISLSLDRGICLIMRPDDFSQSSSSSGVIEYAALQTASIDASTGALHINLTRLITLPGPLQRQEKLDFRGHKCYAIALPTLAEEDCSNTSPEGQPNGRTFVNLHLFSTQYLDSGATKVGRGDELFALENGSNEYPLMFLILRRDSDAPTFKLVATCQLVLFNIPGTGVSENLEFRLSRLRHWRRHGIQELWRKFHTPHPEIALLFGLLVGDEGSEYPQLAWAPCLDLIREEMISRGMYCPVNPDFDSTLVSTIDPKLRPRACEGWLEITVEVETWLARAYPKSIRRGFSGYRIQWEWWTQHEWKKAAEFPYLDTSPASGAAYEVGHEVTVRFRTQELRHIFQFWLATPDNTVSLPMAHDFHKLSQWNVSRLNRLFYDLYSSGALGFTDDEVRSSFQKTAPTTHAATVGSACFWNQCLRENLWKLEYTVFPQPDVNFSGNELDSLDMIDLDGSIIRAVII